ncbi:MAG: translation initiation factor IF-2 subunit alpha [Candidatus Woesearchaeota archaeon]
MLYSKKGYPEESEVVLCTVKKIHNNSVFVVLDEYDRTGIINISEISPGRIRNIRDYVKEGKKCICKVLRVNEERGHIDLSLRRVTESQRREKNEMIKQEQKAEKIVEMAAEELKKPMKELYGSIRNKSGYPTLHSCFEDVAVDSFSLDKILDKDASSKLTELIKQRIKPPEVMIEGKLNLVSYDPEGVEIVREALKRAQGDNIILKYSGGGEYRIKVTSEDYKTAEDILKRSTEAALNLMEEKGGEGSFARIEND